jgi:CubicO group peptidase (beta-lactamase class C family)
VSGDGEMTGLEDRADAAAIRSGLSGVVRIDDPTGRTFERAYGLADRAHGVANTPDTRIAIASGSKGFTALAVITLIEEGALALGTPAREVLGADLPSIADDVTVEHLLSHRSGIGDYLDESELEVTDHSFSVGAHLLESTEAFVPLLDGHPTVFPAGERFAYNNGAFVVLALIAERVSGRSYHDLVRERVCRPAGMTRTEFLRMDELPGDAALGYLFADGLRTNVLHMPVLATGDGGIFTTAADVRAFWTALFAGRIVPETWVEEMRRPRATDPEDGRRYGLGLWLAATGDTVMLNGYDAGASFWSAHDPVRGETRTVLSNASGGAWPVVEVLDDQTSS